MNNFQGELTDISAIKEALGHTRKSSYMGCSPVGSRPPWKLWIIIVIGYKVISAIQLLKGFRHDVVEALPRAHPQIGCAPVRSQTYWKFRTSTIKGYLVTREFRLLEGSRPVFLFYPKYRLVHPENYLFVLSMKIFSGSKYPKMNLFNFEKRSTGPDSSSLMLVKHFCGLKLRYTSLRKEVGDAFVSYVTILPLETSPWFQHHLSSNSALDQVVRKGHLCVDTTMYMSSIQYNVKLLLKLLQNSNSNSKQLPTERLIYFVCSRNACWACWAGGLVGKKHSMYC